MNVLSLRCDRCGEALLQSEGPTVRCDACGASLRVDLLSALPPHAAGHAEAGLRAPLPRFAGAPVEDARAPARKAVRRVLFALTAWSFATAVTLADPLGWRVHTSGAPTLREVSVRGDVALSLTGLTEGVRGTELFGGPCHGYVPARPHLTLRVQETSEVTMLASARASLVIVLRDEAGVARCSGYSTDGTSAFRGGALGPGTYRVWVGTHEEDRRVGFSLDLRAHPLGSAAPLPNGLVLAQPSQGRIDLDANPSGQSAPFTVLGSYDASQIQPSCRGSLSFGPTFELVTRTPRRVQVVTTGSVDLVAAALVGERTWLCDDDGASPNPRLVLDLPPGTHRVWVGSYHPEVAPPPTTQLVWSPAGGPQ